MNNMNNQMNDIPMIPMMPPNMMFPGMMPNMPTVNMDEFDEEEM